MKKILRFLKNILFPKVYAPWEDPINGSNLTHDERVEMTIYWLIWTRGNKNE